MKKFKTYCIGWLVAGALSAVAVGFSGANLINAINEMNEPDEYKTYGDIPADGTWPDLAATD